MERARAVLLAVGKNKDQAEPLLKAAIQADPEGRVIAGLAAFIVAALDGFVADPEKL